MAVVSTLRAAGIGLRCLTTPLTRNTPSLLPVQGKNLGSLLSRGSHDGHVMKRLPSQYEYRKWKDHVHFFFALGLIPMGALIFTVNLYHGPCELSEIPESYEPEHWEYYPHPIQRWFSRYIYDNPQKTYERTLHILNYENQRRILRLTEKRVRELMADRQDVKGWYYVPTNERRVVVARNFEEEVQTVSASR